MSGVNKVILIGNLGKDPVLKYLNANTAKLSFSLATKEIYTDIKGQRAEHTEWHNVILWSKLAENAEKILKKGMQVYIEGKLQTRKYDDKDGHTKQITEIVAEHFILLQSKDTKVSGIGNPFPSKLTD